MSAWDKFDYWKQQFVESAPMMIVEAWSRTNARPWAEDLLGAVTPEALAAATKGSYSKEAIAAFIVAAGGDQLVVEVVGDLDGSHTGRVLLEAVTVGALERELVGAFKDQAYETDWWRANATEVRRACARHKTAASVLGS